MAPVPLSPCEIDVDDTIRKLLVSIIVDFVNVDEQGVSHNL